MKTFWHRLLGALLTYILTSVNISVQTDVPIMTDPPEVDILLLRRYDRQWTQDQRLRLPDGIRDSPAHTILIEFKATESVNLDKLRQITAYGHFYWQNQKLGLKRNMPEIEVAIVRIADEAFPGFVECRLIDAHGQEHTFVEKAPVVSAQEISAHSAFPVSGHVGCQIESELEDETGRVLLHVDTTQPYGIESISGQTKFDLLPGQVSR